MRNTKRVSNFHQLAATCVNYSRISYKSYNVRSSHLITRILLLGEGWIAYYEAENTLRGSVRGHCHKNRRSVRSFSQTNRSFAIALGSPTCSIYARRIHCPPAQIETHARFTRSSKFTNYIIFALIKISSIHSFARTVDRFDDIFQILYFFFFCVNS